MEMEGFGNVQCNREDSEGCDLELWGCVQVDVRARREQQGIKWLFSVSGAIAPGNWLC